MSVPIEKFAPTAITMAAVAWCCWPHMNGATPRIGAEEAALPEITQALLSPTINSVCQRDPFQPTSLGDTASEKDTVPAEPPDNATELPAAESPPTRPIYAPPTASTEPAPEVLIAQVLRQLALNATYIQGDRRVAVINGRIFREGDVLARCGSSKEPCTVQRVFRDRVRIQYRGRNTEFGYRGPSVGKANEEHDE
ncbi:MAG: hypothetical protein HQ582_11640 [Planctomycetes bacterium]|nr:hypothetical protein [Planctomycetota bacterium]